MNIPRLAGGVPLAKLRSCSQRRRTLPAGVAKLLLAGLLALLLGLSSLPAAPINPQDWTADTNNVFGGRSAFTNGALVFWTELPLAQPEDDEDDQRILYYLGFVPQSGPYELRATVHLPTEPLTAHEPESDLVPFYELGLVASGLVIPGLPENNLPGLTAAILYRDLPEYGVQAGDVALIWEGEENGPPNYLRLDSPIYSLDLRIVGNGVGQMELFFRPVGQPAWQSLTTQAVELRGGFHSRAELIGQAGNLLVPREQAGRISDFQVGFSPITIGSLTPGPAAGQWTVSWLSETNAAYTLWGAPNLFDWMQLDNTLVGTGGLLSVVHQPAAFETKYFYRVSRN